MQKLTIILPDDTAAQLAALVDPLAAIRAFA
jgi:hypothetical protein